MTLGAVSDGGVLPKDLTDLLLAVRPWWSFIEETRKLASRLSSAELRSLDFSGLLRLARGISLYAVSPA